MNNLKNAIEMMGYIRDHAEEVHMLGRFCIIFGGVVIVSGLAIEIYITPYIGKG